MKRSEVEEWLLAARERPLRTITLIGAAAVLVAFFSWSTEVGRTFARLGELAPQNQINAIPVKDARSMPFGDWLVEQQQKGKPE